MIGPLGAGKSTILNILSSQSQSASKKVFKSSNALTGCTQLFDYTEAVVGGVGSTVLYDSPGLSDPNLPIDKWIALFNNTIAK